MGIALVMVVFVPNPEARFALAEGPLLRFVGAINGASAGLGAELLLRVALRPRFRFSIPELLIAMTLLATVIVAASFFGRWLSWTA